MILFIDNYDSFIWNLVYYMGEVGVEVVVCCNDVLIVDEVLVMGVQGILVLFGFCDLVQVGIIVLLIKVVVECVLLLFGVCFGYQVIGEVFGGKVVWVLCIVYGKIDVISYDGIGVFFGLFLLLMVMCYYLLIIEFESLFDCLCVIVISLDGMIMGIMY